MAGDLRAGRQSTRRPKRVSTLTDDDVGQRHLTYGRITDNVGQCAAALHFVPAMHVVTRVTDGR